jgi:hypothetical protein
MIILLGRVSSGIVVEDGIMNYYITGVGKTFKVFRYLQNFLLRIVGYWGRFECTYLLRPNDSTMYLGEQRKIFIDTKLKSKAVEEVSSFINGKAILIGGGIIETLFPKEKREVIKNICRQLSIDCYFPHHSDGVGGCGVDSLNISDMGITLEMVYPHCRQLKIYSFGSSAALNAMEINSQIEVYYIRIAWGSWLNTDFDRLMLNSHRKVLMLERSGKLELLNDG